jgi:dTMP kinase
MTPSLFLSLDGIDGTGKTTQVRLLADWLRALGREAFTCSDPGGTPLGDRLRALLLDHREEMCLRAEAFLFMASRAELVERSIRRALAAGSVVVTDRFVLANVVYQGYAGGMDTDDLWELGRLSTGGLLPDLTIVLDLPIEQARARRGTAADRMERRPLDYQERVRQGFLAEARRQPESVRVIDATPAVDVVQEQIRDLVKPLLGR